MGDQHVPWLHSVQLLRHHLCEPPWTVALKYRGCCADPQSGAPRKSCAFPGRAMGLCTLEAHEHGAVPSYDEPRDPLAQALGDPATMVSSEATAQPCMDYIAHASRPLGRASHASGSSSGPEPSSGATESESTLRPTWAANAAQPDLVPLQDKPLRQALLER